MFILAQFLSILSCIINVIGLQCKTKKNILLSMVFGGITSFTALFLLKAYSGFILQLIFVIQVLINYIFDVKKISITKVHVIIYIIIAFICGIYSYSSLIDILPLIATILHTVAILQPDGKRLRIINLTSVSLWIPYYICFMAFGNLASVVCIVASNITAIIRYDVAHKQNKIKS